VLRLVRCVTDHLAMERIRVSSSRLELEDRTLSPARVFQFDKVLDAVAFFSDMHGIRRVVLCQSLWDGDR
jgi:hypothetical protein